MVEGHPPGDPLEFRQGSVELMPLFFLLVQEQPVLPEQESEDTSEDSLVAVAAADIAETADSADMPEQLAAASVAQGILP